MYTADKDLFLARDGQTVVDGDDERANTLLVRQGGTLPVAEARRYGLVQGTQEIALGPTAGEQEPGQDLPPAVVNEDAPPNDAAPTVGKAQRGSTNKAQPGPDNTK